MLSFQTVSNCWFFRKPTEILHLVPLQLTSSNLPIAAGVRGISQSSWCQNLLTRWGPRRSAWVHLQFSMSSWTADLSYPCHAKVQGQPTSSLCSIICFQLFPFYVKMTQRLVNNMGKSMIQYETRCSLTFLQMPPTSAGRFCAAPLTWLLELTNTHLTFGRYLPNSTK